MRSTATDLVVDTWRRAEANECRYLRQLTRAVEAENALFFFHDKAKIPLLNHVAHVRAERDDIPKLIKRAHDFYHRRVPFTCFHVSPMTQPSNFPSIVADQGFQAKARRSILLFELNDRRLQTTQGVEVVRVEEDGFDVWFNLFFASFRFAREAFGGLHEAYGSLLGKPAAALYLACVNGHPVGTATLFSLDSVGGVYNISAHPLLRRKGVATALTMRALNDSHGAGNDLHCLQVMRGSQGERLQLKLGFETMFYDQLFIHPRSTPSR